MFRVIYVLNICVFDLSMYFVIVDEICEHAFCLSVKEYNFCVC